MIKFNQTSISEIEKEHVLNALEAGQLAGEGEYYSRLQDYFWKLYGRRSIITTSCTDALEMACLLTDLREGDEVIVPSYTFSSTALSAHMQGATVVFCDIDEYGTICPTSMRKALSDKTKAVIPIHYSCNTYDAESIEKLTHDYNPGIKIIEDAAQGFDMRLHGKKAGTFGDFSAFSFHQTKALCGGELGAILLDDDKLEYANFLAEKGTDRSRVLNGLKDKYTWVAKGSSFKGSNLLCSLLWAQILRAEELRAKREFVWAAYTRIMEKTQLSDQIVDFSRIREGCSSNFHGFWILFKSTEHRAQFLKYSAGFGLQSYIGYSDLATSPYVVAEKEKFRTVGNNRSIQFSNCLARLPVHSMDKDTAIVASERLQLVLNKIKNEM